jgi:hypothetical protein
MAIASGSCPSCGAPIEFKVGASVAKVCEYCKATVYRTDRGLEDLGKVAAIANVPSLVAVDDDGVLAGRPFRVAGRVQLDHGSGPWDEFYVAFDGGSEWGWLAYAEGTWYVTSLVTETLQPPSFERLHVEGDVLLGRAGMFRIAEMKTGRVVSAEGELPARMPPGFTRHYVDLFGASQAFATIDYGDRSAPPEIFVGRRFEERELSVVARAPRTVAKVKMGSIRCPNCGGELPKLSGERAERVGCRYCGAVSDIAAQKVISAQDVSRMESPIPIGSTGTLYGAAFTAIACLQRSTQVEGEWFSWVEVLLFAEGVGFRWLVRDETSWLFVVPVNLAELDLRGMPGRVHLQGHRYSLRNSGVARVDYVLGEVYWKCEVGETVRASDYVLGTNVLSREESPGEVRWSHSTAVPWPVVAQAFGLSRDRPGIAVEQESGANAGTQLVAIVVVFAIIVVVVLVVSGGSGGGASGGVIFGGSGTYHGGK